MSRKKSKPLEIFSLSFLDCICCGFGAIILIFILTTGRGLKIDEKKVAAASESIKTLEDEIRAQRETLQESAAALKTAQAQQRTQAKADEITAELEEQIEQKMSELDALKNALAQKSDTLKKQAAIPPPEETPQADTQNLGGFDITGKRIVLLLEASGGMLANTVPEALDALKLSREKRLQSEKWKRAVLAIQTLLAHLPPDARFQVYTYNNDTNYVGDSSAKWLPANQAEARLQISQALEKLVPAGGANLEKAFKHLRPLHADTIIIVTDGLPTQADSFLTQYSATQADRIRMLKVAQNILPKSTRISTLILPMAGDPAAVPYYWRLAIDTGGSLISPAKSWP